MTIVLNKSVSISKYHEGREEYYYVKIKWVSRKNWIMP